jgi:O-acetyl-ADP-ribose deacetylase (regulator of RNase III)
MDKKILLDKLLNFFGVLDIPEELKDKRDLYEDLVMSNKKEITNEYLDDEDKYLRAELVNRKLIDAEKYPCINKTLNDEYINGDKVALIKADYLDIYTDVLINPVDKSFNFKRGLKTSKRIFLNAGMRLRKKCVDLGAEDLLPGDVLITRAYNLLSDFVIHVVLPSEKGNKKVELGISYFNNFECANNNLAQILVLPSLEFKKYGLTFEEGIETALYETMKYLANGKCLFEKVILCVDTDKDFDVVVDKLKVYKKSS